MDQGWTGTKPQAFRQVTADEASGAGDQHRFPAKLETRIPILNVLNVMERWYKFIKKAIRCEEIAEGSWNLESKTALVQSVRR